jgi:hypothetical protein
LLFGRGREPVRAVADRAAASDVLAALAVVEATASSSPDRPPLRARAVRRASNCRNRFSRIFNTARSGAARKIDE